MKKLLPIVLACLCWCGTGYSQLVNTVVSQKVHDGVEAPELAGQTTYRIFLQVTNPTDFVTEVQGDDAFPLNVSSSTSFYRHPAHADNVKLDGISDFLTDLPGFEALKWSSGVTIGLATGGTYGIPFEENEQGNIPGSGGSVTPLQDGENPWFGNFVAGGDIDISSFVGGAWFSLNGGFEQTNNVNGYGVGVNNSVLVGQFTTDGDFSYNINTQVLENLEEGGNIQHIYKWSEDTGLGLSFPVEDEPVFGCTDATACNFDELATDDDESCEFESCAGCTNEAACNYDETATISTETCIIVDGGTISTDSETTTCAGDGIDDVVVVNVEGSEGPNMIYVITDEELNILGVSETNEINLEGAGAGVCLLWNLSYDDDVSLDITNAGDLAGCFSLSNSISVTREAAGCTDPNALNYDEAACGNDELNLELCEYDVNEGPENDTCADATPLNLDEVAAGSSVGGTSTSDAGGSTGTVDVWFSFEGTGGLVDVEVVSAGLDLNGGSYDTQLLLYTECGGEDIAFNDDGGAGLLSLIEGFCSEEGVTYYVELQGFNTSDEGDYEISVATSAVEPDTYCGDPEALNFEEDPAACTVQDDTICFYSILGCTDEAAFNFNEEATEDDGSCLFNDACADATPITVDGEPVLGDNTGATDENDDTEPVENGGCWLLDGDDGDVWFSFEGTGGLVNIETFCLGNTDTQIAVYDACDGNLVACDEDGAVAPNCGFMSLISDFCSEDGVTYYIEVEGYNGADGDFTISVVSSESEPATYCSDEMAINFNDAPSACDVEDNTTCEYNEGCTNELACNFDADAVLDDGSCIVANGGEISTSSSLTTCAGDGEDDIVVVDVTGAEGPNMLYVVTDEELNILATSDSNEINFEGAGAGVCLIWNLSYGDDVDLNITNAGELAGCFDLSNSLSVTREAAGCTDDTASNFDADACGDDGSCVFDNDCTLDCPDDLILECGSDTSTSSTGMAMYSDACDDNLGEITFTDVITGDACVTTIERTFTGGGLSCTQTILVTDSEGPVFPEVNDIVVECVEDIPAQMDFIAVDACTGEEIPSEAVEVPVGSGGLTEVCELSDAFGPGADWSVWLQGFGPGASDNFVWDADGGSFDVYADGTAHLYGNVVNDSDPTQGWIVDMWFENGQDWDSWMSQGRWYKDDLGFGADHYEDWMYYELLGYSTLTGTGSFAGDQLLLTHNPESFFFGFQCGIGANNKNANEGFSGWFYYQGNVGGLPVSGNGDVNVDKTCEPVPPNDSDCPDTELTYLYRAIDGCGNATIVSQLVTVEDTTAPVFDELPADMTVSCEEGPGDLLPLTATDNCVGEITYQDPEEQIIEGTCDNTYTVIRTWSASDACGNPVEHMQTIEVIDETAPVITCPEDITHSCEETPDYGMATATDNCTEMPAVTMVETVEGDDCGSVITRVYTATDECGNASSCTQTITIFDDQAPVFDPFTPYLTVECSDSDSVEADVTATDNCNGVTMTYVDVMNSGGCLGVVERTYTAVDACGNTATAVQYISLQDTTPPVITCPDDVDHQCDENPDYGMATATDNCGLDVTITMEETSEVLDCTTTITRTYTATDYCDNVSTCTQTITISDTTAPVLEVPADMTHECDETPDYGMATATDNCDEEVEIELTETTEAGDCPQEMVITRVFRAFDDCGNEAMATQTITIVDTTAPVLTVPEDVTYECDDQGDSGMATATDNCGEVTITFTDVESGDSCESTTVRTWTATDECGNATSADQTITVVDTTAPVITCPADLTHECDETPDYGMATATDNCQEPTITMEEVITGDVCETVITRTFTAVDGCGNSTECVQTITIVDTTAPVIEGPSELDMACDMINDDLLVTATDNCSDVTLTFEDDAVSGGCVGQIIRTYTATDACQNSSTFVQILDLFDDVAPEITCPADMTIECGDDMPEMTEPTVSDNCTEVTLSSEVTTEGDDCVTTVTRTWTATDECGNSSTCDQVITIIDTTAPVLTVPADVTYECDDQGDSGMATATDECNEVTITFTDSQDGDCTSVTTRTWTATDACGNATSADQLITVVDTTAPVITCPEDLTHECDETPDYGMATATDNCNEVTLSSEDVTTGDACETVITRTWTATDACGNASSCEQTITIVDTTAPVITAAPEVEVPCDGVDDTIYATVTDNCTADVDVVITFEDLEVSGGCANVQVIRTYTATDDCGNSSEFVQILDLVDTVPPVMVCAEDMMVECSDEMPMFTAPEVTDNCTEVTVTFEDSSEDGDCTSSMTRTWTATDECGNSSTCSQTITVSDTTAPELTVPADVTYECTDTVDAGMATAEDACSEATVTSSDVTTGDACSTTIVRTWTATDECGNTTSTDQTITILDTTAPELTVPADITYECSESPETGMATATDACNEVTITSTDVTTGDVCETVITRTWTATDACGNATSADQTITIVDTTAPVITCPADITHECDETPDYGLATATDDCDDDVEVTFSDLLSDTDCGSVITRTWTATDACENSTSCTQTITIVDTTAPVVAVEPMDVTIECGETAPEYTPEWSDNCDLQLELSAISGIESNDTCEEVISESWTATDNCGNSTTVSRTITIVDTTAPVITCPADVTADCSDTANDYGMATAEDSCNEVTVTSSDETTGDACETVITRTWTATDACGNATSCVQTITITDTTAPVLTVPADVTAECSDLLDAGMATATDDCNEVTVTSSDVTSGDDCESVITRTWTATDACGNTTSADQTITIVDTTAPVFGDLPGDQSYQCLADVPAQVNPTATDNCQVAMVTCTQDEDLDDCGNGTITVTCVATDGCGNMTEIDYVITIQDTEAPMLTSMPADLVLDCDDEVPAAPEVTAVDNCDEDVTVFYTETIIGDNTPEEGSIATCVLNTPQPPVCTANEDGWALKLFDFVAGYEFFDVQTDGLFVEYEDGTAHLTGTLVAQNNPNAFFTMDVWLENGLNWEDWSDQAFPTSFKDDCDIITDEYLDYTYYVMTEGAATLTGSGDLAGSSFDLTHAPINLYYGYQVGIAANNVNGNYGNGGWFYGTGTLVDAVTQTTYELEDFQGDFAFGADCCPQYTIERTWYAEDCSGNVSELHTQTISFEDLGSEEEGAGVEAFDFDEMDSETGLTIGNIFPNPVRDIARVNYAVAKSSVVTLDVLDMNGNLIETLFTGSVEGGVTYQEMFETSNIESGVYMIRLSSDKASEMERVVVAK